MPITELPQGALSAKNNEHHFAPNFPQPDPVRKSKHARSFSLPDGMLESTKRSLQEGKKSCFSGFAVDRSANEQSCIDTQYTGFERDLFSSTASTCIISEGAKEIYAPKQLNELSLTDIAAQAAELQRRIEDIFLSENKGLISILRVPKEYSISKNQAVVEILSEHAKKNGESAPLCAKFLREMLVIGENVAKAIFSQELVDPGAAGYTLPVISDGTQSYEIKSEIYIVRALSWYMMAVAASQDLERQAEGDFSTSDMTTSGTFVMKDPDNRIYHFLNNCRGKVDRTSTHFEKYLAHDDEHKFFGVISSLGLKKSQRGIEDYRSLFPYPCGAMLFDRIQLGKNKQSAIFIKFEEAGCPSGFEINGCAVSYESAIAFLAACGRNAAHALHFVSSRSHKAAQGSGEVIRQEHVHKGVMYPLYQDFLALKKNQEFKVFLEENKNENPEKNGITATRDVLANFCRSASMSQGVESGEASIAYKSADALLKKINGEMQRLGLVSDRYGIPRIGAEVHITLDPNEVHGPRPVQNLPYARTEADFLLALIQNARYPRSEASGADQLSLGKSCKTPSLVW